MTDKHKRLEEIEIDWQLETHNDQLGFNEISWLIKELKKAWKQNEIYKDALVCCSMYPENPALLTYLQKRISITVSRSRDALKQAEEVE